MLAVRAAGLNFSRSARRRVRGSKGGLYKHSLVCSGKQLQRAESLVQQVLQMRISEATELLRGQAPLCQQLPQLSSIFSHLQHLNWQQSGMKMAQCQ